MTRAMMLPLRFTAPTTMCLHPLCQLPDNRPVKIIDKPVKLNLHNYETRLRKLLTVLRIMTADLEEALERYEKEKRG